MKKRISLLAVLLFSLVFLSGCGLCVGMAQNLMEGKPTNKKLTTYYNDSAVIAARFYLGGESYNFEDLPTEKIDALVETLDSMELKSKAFHSDYFWAGQYGIELTYEDGTYLTYDGTFLDHRNLPIDAPANDVKSLHSGFVEVTNTEFWKEMVEYFPSVKGTLVQ